MKSATKSRARHGMRLLSGPPRTRSRGILGAIACAVSILVITVHAGCGDGDAPAGPDAEDFAEFPRLTVSNPVDIAGPARAAASGTDARVYVSASPGTFPQGDSVTIANLVTGESLRVGIVDGGFDPVSLDGSSGEVLEFVVRNGDGSETTFRASVPDRVPPRVVRTRPPRDATTVALNATALVVLSEPVDGGTITTETMKVLLDSEPIEGTVTLSADGLRAEFTPATDLAPATTYTIVITTGVLDLAGDALEEEVTATFTTQSVPAPAIAFYRSGENGDELVVMQEDGGNQTVVHTTAPYVRNGFIYEMFPAWSPDGRRIAFRVNSESETWAQLWTVEVEVGEDGKPRGKNPQPLVTECSPRSWVAMGCQPAWSPTRDVIAFTVSAFVQDGNPKLWVIDANGGANPPRRLLLETESSTSQLTSPTWSPDGRFIAVVEGCKRITVLEVNPDAVEPVVSRQHLDYEGILDCISDIDWAPTGNVLALDAMLPVPNCCTRTVFTVNLSAPEKLNFVAEGITPTWSRDDAKLAIVQVVLQGEEVVPLIMSVNVNTGATTTLASHGRRPDWAKGWSGNE